VGAAVHEAELTTETAEPLRRAPRRRRLSPRDVAERWSLVLAFLVAFAVFAIARPDTFLTLDNARAILDDTSVLCVLAVGVTAVLVIGEFDLSIGFVVGLGAAACVAAMAFRGWPVWLAIALALVVGAAAGLANGVAVSFIGIPSFVATLAIGSIAAAVELAIASTSIFEGIPASYVELSLHRPATIPIRALVALGVVVLFLVLLRATVFGRHAAAVGDNPAAALLAGVPVRRVRVLAFVLAGLTAGLAAVLVTSSAGSYYPNLGTGYLLPAYAAAFLGLSLGGGLRFNVLGSYLGVLLLGMVTTGLTMMNQPSWVAALVQGIVLIAAVAGIAIRRRGALGR
jgi:ribose/xylose/arabinose/galactoside ABC-type transport system permease subunit